MIERNHAVLLIHGIRTQGEWEQRAAAVLESDPTIRVRPTRYGFFDVLRFLLPIASLRHSPVHRITGLLRDELTKRPKKVSIIAHSFGTYIVSRILQEESDIELHRLILCGSIIPDFFPWEKFRHRLGSSECPDWQIVNDCGMKDAWPVLAQSVTWGYGSSGRFGFGHGRVKDRFHAGGHSEFFSAEFVRTYWLPYLSLGHIAEGALDRQITPWWLSVLTVIRIKYILLLVVLLLLPVRSWLPLVRKSLTVLVSSRPAVESPVAVHPPVEPIRPPDAPAAADCLVPPCP